MLEFDTAPAPTASETKPVRASLIHLHCQAAGSALAGLERFPGPGSTVLCAPQAPAVAMAQRLFPDRRLEVKTLFAEPDLGPGPGFLEWRLLRWMLSPKRGEDADAARRRVVETAVRLIALAKEHDGPALVAGPALLRLLALKLNAIGYGGPFVTGFRPGEHRAFRYRV